MTLRDTNALSQLLSQRTARAVTLPEHRHAAVAVLLRKNASGVLIPFTRRADHLRKHSGQISFPGGALDGDETAEQAAVRETGEELGIVSSDIRTLGRLDDVPTPTGFVITPIVAELAPSARFTPAASEVAEVFEVPANYFVTPGVRTVIGVRQFGGTPFELLAYDYQERRIWGATARIVDQLVSLWTNRPT